MAKEINIFEEDLEIPLANEEEQARIEEEESMNVAEYEEENLEVVLDLPQREHSKRVLEALLFASAHPLPFQKIREILASIHPFKPKELLELIEELKQDYEIQKRAFRLEEIADGYLLRTGEEFHPHLQMLFQTKRKEKLSPAGLETLAIIAYKQPVTRLQIEAFRGVDSSGIVQALLDRQLIEAAGKLEVPGRPTLYKTTEEFLKHFGLKDLSELPKLVGGS